MEGLFLNRSCSIRVIRSRRFDSQPFSSLTAAFREKQKRKRKEKEEEGKVAASKITADFTRARSGR